MKSEPRKFWENILLAAGLLISIKAGHALYDLLEAFGVVITVVAVRLIASKE